MKRVYLTVSAIMLVTTSLVHGQADVYLRAYTKTFQRMEIDLYPMQASGQAAELQPTGEMILNVLSNDLWMSGYFQVNQRTGESPMQNGGQPASDGASRAIAYITGEFNVEGGQIIIKPLVRDMTSGKPILKSDYVDGIGQERLLVHKLADDIVYRLTGEGGIARTRVAFIKQNAAGAKEIATMDYDGHNVSEITADNNINLLPAWSPDGRRLSYTSYKEDNPNLYVLNIGSKLAVKVSALAGLNTAASWSPDGRNIALILTKDGNAEIYVMNVESKSSKRLTFSRAIDSSPTWSPSNREISFTSDRSGSPQVYIMDSDGLNLRRLTFAGSYNDSPAWSPKGDKIAYVSRTASGFDIYTIDVTGENNMRLTDSSGSNENPSWSPNGFSLIFSSTRGGKKDLYSMFWDGSDQKRLTTNGINYAPAWSPRLK